MNSDLFSYMPVGLAALVAGAFLFKILKHGGFKGALFGARIEHSVGEVSGSGGKHMRSVIKVHMLQGDSADRTVGIECVIKSFASYQMVPLTLSVSEARQLISLLESAVRGR
jgi:hypothetical protein